MKLSLYIKLLLFYTLSFTISFSQNVSLSNSIKLFVPADEYEFSVENKKGVNIIDFYQFTDPSKSGVSKLPSKSIIIAIPPNSNPSLKILSKKEKIIENTIPESNSRAIKLNDSTLVYETTEVKTQLFKNNSKPIVELGQKFWVRDFYCVEVKINSHQFDPSTNSIIVYENVEIELEFEDSYNFQDNSPIQIKSQFDNSLKEIIYNSNIAEQFRSNQRGFEINNLDSWINYNNDYIKIAVTQDGIYRLNKTDLGNIGAPVNSIDLKTFQLFESGTEQQIFVSGETDGAFDEGDYIEFYGTKNYSKNDYRTINSDNQPYNTYLNIYTDTTYYFLTWGSTNGVRYNIDDSNVPGIHDELNYHTTLLHFEENTMYQNLNNNEVLNQTSDWNKNKTWYWNWIFSTRNLSVSLQDLYPGIDARYYLKLSSAGSNISTNAHQVTLEFNGTQVDSQSIDRFKQALFQPEISHELLQQGNNTIRVRNINNGTVPNFLAYDWYEIEYPRYNKLVNDSLIITIPDGFNNEVVQLKFTNANESEYEIFKVSGNSKKIENYSVNSGELTFVDTVSSGDKYAVFGANQIASPQMEYIGQFTNLRADNSAADYIAINPETFTSSVENYLNQIEDLYDLTTKRISVEDIFNEFGYGYPTPESIKEFAQYAFNNWSSPKPSYLVLFGDSNYDYKDYVYDNVGVKLSQNYIPSFGNPVSDNWYAIWGDGPFIPQLKVGRIPILTSNQLDTYLQKILHNENAEFSEWNKKYLLFSGGVGSNPNELRQLKAANDSLVSNVISPRPISGNYNHFYKTTDPVSDFGPYTPAEISNAIDDGGVFISYVGHSGTATWDNSINDVTQLKNNVNRNPIISDFGCSTNKYAEPDIICFGERFLLDGEGQALNYIGNSSLGFVSTAVSSPKYFYESFLTDSLFEVGNAHINIKSRLYNIFGNSSVFKVFSLSNVILGDPAVRLKIPHSPNLTFDDNPILIDNAEFSDIEDSSEISIVVTNLGRADQQQFTIKIEHFFEDDLINTRLLSRILPGYKDTISTWIETKSLAGEHKLSVTLDPENQISELDETDNIFSNTFTIYSSELKDLIPYTTTNGSLHQLNILNPISYSNTEFNILTQISDNINFSNPQLITDLAGELVTKIELPNLSGKRNWIRYKIDVPETEFSIPKSFSTMKSDNFFLSDEFAFSSQLLSGLEYSESSIKLSIDSLDISVLSAGWYAGATCVIAKNGINLLDNSFFAGMGIVVFDDVTMEVDTATWFQLFDNRPNALALAELINNIPEGKTVVMGVSDDGQHRLISELRTAIKTLGSEVIDQLQFRGSWAIIGRKGASPGDPDIIEEVKGPYDGSVYLEKEYIVPNQTGYLTTERLGPVSSWDTLYVNHEIPDGTSIDVIPIGIRKSQQEDTLSTFSLSSQYTSLDFINPNTYPYSKLRFKFTQNDQAESPTISEIGVSHRNAPELAINYQTASLSTDSLIQGQALEVNFKVSNVGEGTASLVVTKVDLFKENQFVRTIFDSTFATVNMNTMNDVLFGYVTKHDDGYGEFKFLIQLDVRNNNVELYEDNNQFELPFVVLKDTVTSVASALVSASFDGYEIYDGDYVSPDPQIDVFLDYQGSFNITDTNSVRVLLNQKQISQSQLHIKNDTQQKRLTLSFTPQLENGDYTLSVMGDDLRSANDNNSNFVRFFKVSNESKILYPYNYPNPFNSNTHFTFKLTKVPDKIRIKIYTVAGRLVREINVYRDQLNFDFNRIFWDGRDEDGDLLANGVYIYKIISEDAGDKVTITNKLAIVR